MLSLRISPEQTRAIDEISARQNLSRSEWLRQLIDRTVSEQSMSPHDHYMELMRDLDIPDAAYANAYGSDGARNHSQELSKAFGAKAWSTQQVVAKDEIAKA
jgi:hypothetical protein